MTEYPKNNNNYSWNDLTEIAKIVDKSYYIFHGFDNVMKYYEDIENNADIKYLKNNKSGEFYFNSTLIEKNNCICKYNEKDNKSKVLYFKSTTTDSEFFAFTYFDTLIILFLGTNSIDDCKIDLTLDKEKMFLNGRFCNIHRGFYEQYYSLKSQVLEVFSQYNKKFKNSKVVILGHSLGTIGQLFSFDIKNVCSSTSLDLITFGSPCVGDYIFVSLIEKNFDNNIRIVNDDDVVPLFLELFGYSHSGSVIRFKENQIIYESASIWNSIQNIGYSIFKYFLPFFGTNIFINHLMTDYIVKLENILVSK